jgi:hypothetical protein
MIASSIACWTGTAYPKTDDPALISKELAVRRYVRDLHNP